jgi:hypothetical protein
MIGLMKQVTNARPDNKGHQEADSVFFGISRERIFPDLRKQDKAAQKEEKLHDKGIENAKGQINIEMGRVIERNRVAKNNHDNPHALERIYMMIPAAGHRIVHVQEGFDFIY